VSLAVLAKTVEGLSSGFEHILNRILSKASEHQKRSLFDKIKWFWFDEAGVLHCLGENGRLTQSQGDFEAQWKSIDLLSERAGCKVVARDLLKATLIRNHSAHIGLKQFDRDRLLDFAKLLLRVIALTWLHARARGFVKKCEAVGTGF